MFFIGFIFEFLFSACQISQRSIIHKAVPYFRFKPTTTKQQQQKNQTLKPMFSHVYEGHIQINVSCGFECAVIGNKKAGVFISTHSYPDTCIPMNVHVWIIAQCVQLIGRENDILCTRNILFSHINSFSISSFTNNDTVLRNTAYIRNSKSWKNFYKKLP